MISPPLAARPLDQGSTAYTQAPDAGSGAVANTSPLPDGLAGVKFLSEEGSGRGSTRAQDRKKTLSAAWKRFKGGMKQIRIVEFVAHRLARAKHKPGAGQTQGAAGSPPERQAAAGHAPLTRTPSRDMDLRPERPDHVELPYPLPMGMLRKKLWEAKQQAQTLSAELAVAKAELASRQFAERLEVSPRQTDVSGSAAPERRISGDGMARTEPQASFSAMETQTAPRTAFASLGTQTEPRPAFASIGVQTEPQAANAGLAGKDGGAKTPPPPAPPPPPPDLMSKTNASPSKPSASMEDMLRSAGDKLRKTGGKRSPAAEPDDLQKELMNALAARKGRVRVAVTDSDPVVQVKSPGVLERPPLRPVDASTPRSSRSRDTSPEATELGKLLARRREREA